MPDNDDAVRFSAPGAGAAHPLPAAVQHLGGEAQSAGTADVWGVEGDRYRWGPARHEDALGLVAEWMRQGVDLWGMRGRSSWWTHAS